MVRAGAPARSMAASSTSAFITVPIMPIASAVGRDEPVARLFGAADQIAAADHHADRDAERARRHEILDDALDRRRVDSEIVRTAERLARDLHDHPAVGRLGHGGPRARIALRCQVVPPAAATSAAKSDVAFSMPSPSAKRL